MGAGKGKSNRARSSVVVANANANVDANALEYEWSEYGDSDVDMPDEEFNKYMNRLTPILDTLLREHSDLRELASQCSWGISSEEEEGLMGCTSRDAETNQLSIVICTGAVESLSDEELSFVIAHELAHIAVGRIESFAA